MTRPETYDAIILAGGAARRLGGIDKPGLVVGGRSLAAAAAAAVPEARALILVGPARPEIPHAVLVREDPPGAGPVPALRAGLLRVGSPWAVLLAGDLPFVRASHIDALIRSAEERIGVVGADETGRPQWLLSLWRTASLRAALGGYEGSSLRGLLEPLRPLLVRLPGASRDCDTPADVERAQRALNDPCESWKEGDHA